MKILQFVTHDGEIAIRCDDIVSMRHVRGEPPDFGKTLVRGKDGYGFFAVQNVEEYTHAVADWRSAIEQSNVQLRE